MSNTPSPDRVEPVLETPAATPHARAVEELRAAIETTPPSPAANGTTTVIASTPTYEPAPVSPPQDTTTPSARGALDQLSRIEDKVARIEEKYARTESQMTRVQDKVETAMGRMGEVALQSDLVALRNQLAQTSDRIRKVPGFGTLLTMALITAVLAAVLTILAQRYIPGLLVR